METQAIKDSIELNASKEKVWDVLTQDKFNRLWFAEFEPGTFVKTDWQVGSKAIFQDESNSGLITKVITFKPNESLVVEYTGILNAGIEDYDSPEAQNVKGGREIYHIIEKDGHTQLLVEADLSPEFYESMASAWERALLKIKELAENE